MKTAVSVPDDLFRLAETAARRLRVSRSQLYTTALAEYLERQRASAITERLNEVYSREDSALDPVLMKIQLASIDSLADSEPGYRRPVLMIQADTF